MASIEPILARRIEEWKASGLIIVFTNGVFDLLHPGHVKQLRAARACGDVLIVGLNSDASVRGLGKGDGRPIMDEQARVGVLEELRCVDALALFDEPTPRELIALIEPDVLVKGADYADKVVEGRDIVEARGGRVVLVALEPGYSTTSIVERIRGGE